MNKLSKSSSVTLDFIRGASAQLVLVGHGVSFCGIAAFLHPPNFPWLQNIGVVIFFILSGFLITYSLNSKHSQSGYGVFHYFIDRFTRIYIPFIAALVFVVIIDAISIELDEEKYRHIDAFNVTTFMGNVFMLQDYPKIDFVTSFGSARPFWTVAIEWWIYLFVGSVYFFLKDRSFRIYYVLIIASLAVVPAYNILGGRGNGLTLYWIFGALLYVVFNNRLLEIVSTRKLLILCFAFVSMALYRVLSTMEAYDPLFALLLSVTILLSIEISSRIHLRDSFVAFARVLAGYSYTLYLIHYTIFDFLVTHYGRGYSVFFIGFVISNLLAYIMARLFEVTATRYVKKSMYGFVK